MSVKLVFLGTGSGKPTPQRGVSCVILVRDGHTLMFDCGEGSQIQLARSSVRPGGLEAVFLTHFHGDHVNGLPGFIGSLTLNQREHALDTIGPIGLKRWFAALRELNILWPSFPVNAIEVSESGVVWSGDGFRVEARPLRHRIPTWGYLYVEDERPGRFDVEAARSLGVPAGPLFGKLQRGESVTLDDGTLIEPSRVLGPGRPGLRIAYCTDTSPCDGALELARDADVLIHEATYPAGEEKLAKSRGHSTAADAARCARDAGARFLVLTHISQKYQRTDVYLEGAREIFEDTIVAKDLLELEVERQESTL